MSWGWLAQETYLTVQHLPQSGKANLELSNRVVLLHPSNNRHGPRDDRESEPAACEQWDSIIQSRVLGREGKQQREVEIRRHKPKKRHESSLGTQYNVEEECNCSVPFYILDYCGYT